MFEGVLKIVNLGGFVLFIGVHVGVSAKKMYKPIWNHPKEIRKKTSAAVAPRRSHGSLRDQLRSLALHRESRGGQGHSGRVTVGWWMDGRGGKWFFGVIWDRYGYGPDCWWLRMLIIFGMGCEFNSYWNDFRSWWVYLISLSNMFYCKSVYF